MPGRSCDTVRASFADKYVSAGLLSAGVFLTVEDWTPAETNLDQKKDSRRRKGCPFFLKNQFRAFTAFDKREIFLDEVFL